jgi:hypothetical protein
VNPFLNVCPRCQEGLLIVKSAMLASDFSRKKRRRTEGYSKTDSNGFLLLVTIPAATASTPNRATVLSNL